MTVSPRPSFLSLIGRGLLRRCANCGGKGAFFVSWFRHVSRCQTCGLNWQRNTDGFMLGAAAMNAMFTLGSLIVVMIVGVVMTYPEVAAWPIVVVTTVVALVVGIGGYPISYTTWLAVDLAMRPLEPDEIADAQRHAVPSGQAQ
ncbi:MAG: DUF983 domain-containing protein [Actinomycetota bacterium]